MNSEDLEIDEDLESVEKLENRITDILCDVKPRGLTKDSIAMIICLENEIENLERQIDVADSMINLIKNNRVSAEYEGDRNKSFDVNKFRLIMRRHDMAIKNLENMGF